MLLPGDDLAAASAGVTVSYMVVDLFDALVTRQAPVKLPIIAHHLTIIAVMLMSNFSVSSPEVSACHPSQHWAPPRRRKPALGAAA